MRRSEIDSLRGLAVILVLFFHLNLDIQYFKGGFIGVDIFFVISGFLITKILINDFGNRNFQIILFINRRLNRIFPPLVLTIVLTLIISFFIYNSFQYKEVHIISIFSSLFLSNYYFTISENYFENVFALSPLLHTWSLSVEMQFYIFFSLLFFFFYNNTKILFLISIIIILTISSWAIFFVFYNYNSNISFYSTPFRIWEICIGSLTYFFCKTKYSRLLKKRLLNILALVLIILSPLLINKSSFLPLYLLLPTVSTSFFLITYKKKNLFIDNIFFSHVGKISYSLYLFHYPILLLFSFLFENIYFYTLFTILFSYFISILSYNYIEQKFRFKFLEIKKFSLPLNITMIIIFNIYFLLFIFKYSIFTQIYSDYKYNFYKISSNLENFRNISYRFYSNNFKENHKYKKILIVGDSYAGDLFNIIKKNNISNNYEIKTLPLSYPCQYLLFKLNPNKVKNKFQARCKNELKNYYINFNKNNADIIFLAFSWQKDILNLIPKMIEESKFSSDQKIILVGLKDFNKKIDYFINNKIRPRDEKHFSIKNTYINDQEHDIIMLNKKISEKIPSHISFFDYLDYYCNGHICRYFDENYNLLSYDRWHLTNNGIKFFAQTIDFEKYIEN